MRWASALSQKRSVASAMTELTESLADQLDGKRPDLVIAFVSYHFQNGYEQLPDLVFDLLSPTVFLGCSAAGVIGGGVEIEQKPAFSLTAACLPDVTLRSFHVLPDDVPDLDAPPSDWVEVLGVPQEPTAHFVLLADPLTFNPMDLLMGLDFAYSDGAKIGGLASAPDSNVLFVNHDLFSTGAVGVAFQGDVILDTIVAQGCRPIGTPLTITSCHQNLLLEVDERPPIEVLVELYESLPPEDQELMRHSLHVGIATTELVEEFKPGDFLIRNVIGIDQETGVMAVGEMLRNGQTVQFHLRDAETSAEDLHLMLSQYKGRPRATSSAGALLFSCNGRGQHLYGRPNHDSDSFRGVLGEIPLGGFFCAGEIGPVAQSTYLHGFTSSFGIFRPLSS
ncbi:MAG: FIST C-terminal domain-containing protein [Candidatus Latescibacteria bacterium]|nr:FIST C-terminal domain-containing protein [Candidatus Latescibacterota bacterium]